MVVDGREIDTNVEKQKLKKLLNQLESIQGCDLISLGLPRGSRISEAKKMLEDEWIKSLNKESDAGSVSIQQAMAKLHIHSEVPTFGLLLFTGTIITNDCNVEMVAFEHTPFKPLDTYFYHCDIRFQTEALRGFLDRDESFGFIMMDRSRTRFEILSGNTRHELTKFTADANQKREDYVTKIAKVATEFFVNASTNVPNVSGLILAGCYGLQTELAINERLDPRLKEIILKEVGISHVGEDGFNQAIELSSEILSDVKLIQERKVLIKYFKELCDGTDKYTLGIKDTVTALEMGAVKTLILREDLSTRRLMLKDTITYQPITMYLSKEEEQHVNSRFLDPVTNHELEVIESKSLLEWLIEDYQRFGCSFEFVSKNSREGNQFCEAFEGVGAILHDKLDMRSFDDLDADWRQEKHANGDADDEDEGGLLF